MKLNLQRTARIDSLQVSPDEWELFTRSYPEECRLAAAEMNDTLFESVNSGKTRREVEKRMGEVMRKHADLGACDTEPRWMLERLLNKIYGEEE